MTTLSTPKSCVVSAPSTPTTPAFRAVKRKPPPSLAFRYPEPDPEDPFAPLDVLRFKASSGVVGSCDEENLCSSFSDDDLQTRNSSIKAKRRSYSLYPSPPPDFKLPYSTSPTPPRTIHAAKGSTSSGPHYRRRTHHAFPSGFSDTASLASEWNSLPPLIADDGSGSSPDSSLNGHESDSSLQPKTPSRLSKFLPKSRKKRRTDTRSVVAERAANPSTSAQGLHASPAQTLTSLSPPPSPTHSPNKRPTNIPDGEAPSNASTSMVTSNLSNLMAQPHTPPQPSQPLPSSEEKAQVYFPPIQRSTSFVQESSGTSSPPKRSRQSSLTVNLISAERSQPHHHSQSHHSLLRSDASAVGSSHSSFIVINPSTSTTHDGAPTLETQHPAASEVAGPSILPTIPQLALASSSYVVAENGIRVQFSDLFTSKKTIVLFLRHFWCSFDHAYLDTLSKEVDRQLLRQEGVKVVLIGSGSPSIIKSYRQIFRLPFDLYVDPTLELYRAFGLTTITKRPHEPSSTVRTSPRYSGVKFLLRAVRSTMPLWDRAGETCQLGGEFIFEGVLSPLWAHRMATVDGHAPVQELLELCKSTTPKPAPEGLAVNVVAPTPTDASFSESDSNTDGASSSEVLVGHEALDSEITKRDKRMSMSTSALQDTLASSGLKLDKVDEDPLSIEKGVDDCLINPLPRTSSLAMTEEWERRYMENRKKSLMMLTAKKSERRGFIDENGKATHVLAWDGLPPSSDEEEDPREEEVRRE